MARIELAPEVLDDIGHGSRGYVALCLRER